MEPGAIDEPALDYSGDYTLYLDVEGPEAIDAQDRMIDGQIALNRAFVELEAGFDRFDADEPAAARERFTAAQDELGAARNAFEDVQDHEGARQALRDNSIGLLGIVDDLEEAFERFVTATEESEAGNDGRAGELVSEGWNMIQKAFEE